MRLAVPAALMGLSVIAASCAPEAREAACVERLVAPNYPPIAHSARLTVSGATAAIALDQGRVRDVRVAFPPEAARYAVMFQAAVEDAVGRSRFSAACPAVTIVYDFVHAPDDDPDPPSTQRVAFGPSNHIVVSMTGALIDVSGTP